MALKLSYEEYFSGNELERLIKLTRRRRKIYLICFLIAAAVGNVLSITLALIGLTGAVSIVIGIIFFIAMGVFSSFGAYTCNIILFFTTHGNEKTSILGIIWMIFGGLIIPLILLSALNNGIHHGILGWD